MVGSSSQQRPAACSIHLRIPHLGCPALTVKEKGHLKINHNFFSSFSMPSLCSRDALVSGTPRVLGGQTRGVEACERWR